jgi:hypothetical protein
MELYGEKREGGGERRGSFMERRDKVEKKEKENKENEKDRGA